MEVSYSNPIKRHSTLLNPGTIQSDSVTPKLLKDKFEEKHHVLSTPSLKEPGEGEATEGDAVDKIVASIRESALDHDFEVKTFYGVSADAYDRILNTIAEDDNHYKLSYFPPSKQLTTTLPTTIHEDILIPFREAFNTALGSMNIPPEAGKFIVGGNHMVYGVGEEEGTTMNLGTPDVLIECQTVLARFPLWCAEVAFTQPEDEAMSKLQLIAARSPNIIGITLLNIVESPQYLPPSEKSSTFTQLEMETSIISEETWKRRSNKRGRDSIISYGHLWVSPLSFTITTWLRNSDGQFNLTDHSAEYYASAQLCPVRDDMGLAHLQHLFQRMLLSIKDITIQRLEVVVQPVQDDYNSDSSSTTTLTDISTNDACKSALETLPGWTPPASPLDWHSVNMNLRSAALHTGFNRYLQWHKRVHMCQAEERKQSGSSKRPKIA